MTNMVVGRKKQIEKLEFNSEKEISDEGLRYGPIPTFPNQRQYARVVIALSIFVVVYCYSLKEKERIFASRHHSFKERYMSLECSQLYIDDITKYEGCIPKKCGRAVFDKLISEEEAQILHNLAQRGLALATPKGGAAILNLHSGALSYGDNFINVYTKIDANTLLTPSDLATYKEVGVKVQNAIADKFGIEAKRLHITDPTFFSRLTADPPNSIHDEYWHLHIDKETYESFHYTALLYLSNYSQDFQGGRFLFIEADNSTSIVEPILGRISVFTSGWENPHLVERVTSGVRLALTIGFTCDPALSVRDPLRAN